MKATIEVPYNEGLVQAFVPEDKELDNGRGSYSLEKQNETLCIHVETTDAVALRAMLSSIGKVLSIYEKLKEV